MTHELKIEKQWADAKLAGEKPFEIRLNDRGFQKGDRVQYRVVDPKTHEPYSRPLGETEFGSSTAHPLENCEFEITYVREGTENGLQPKYCVFADRPVRKVGKGIPATYYGPSDPEVPPKTHYAYPAPVPDADPNASSSGRPPSPQVFTTVTCSNGTAIDGTNFRPQDGDGDDLLDAKIEF